MIATVSHWDLRNDAGQVPTEQSLELVCDELMAELLEIEQITAGSVHSAAISSEDSSVTVELTVNVESQEEADRVALAAVTDAIERAGHVLVSAGHSTMVRR